MCDKLSDTKNKLTNDIIDLDMRLIRSLQSKGRDIRSRLSEFRQNNVSNDGDVVKIDIGSFNGLCYEVDKLIDLDNNKNLSDDMEVDILVPRKIKLDILKLLK